MTFEEMTIQELLELSDLINAEIKRRFDENDLKPKRSS